MPFFSDTETKKVKVVLLIGEGHSGSTLLDLIMGSHSKIVGVGELDHFSKFIEQNHLCGCGKKLQECKAWTTIFKDIDYQRLHFPYRTRLRFLFNKEDYPRLAIYRDLTEKVYRNTLSYFKKKIIFDSSKCPNRAEILLGNKNLDVVLLHLVRDGRGVTFSNIRLGRPSFRYMKKWAISNIKAEIIKRRNRSAGHIFVHYRDLVKDPLTTLKYILKKLNLAFEPDMMNFKNKKQHQAGGNYKLRFLFKSNRIQPDMKWKEKMSIKDKLLFNIFFGWLNLFYKLKPRKY